MSPDTWIALAGVVVAVLGIGLPIRFQIRKDARDRDDRNKQATQQAIRNALAPVIDERNYLRTQLRDALRRNEELEDQLRSRSRDDRA